MPIKEGMTLMSYEEDIRGTGMIEWMKGKTETLQTMHRYEGDLILYEDDLVFEGIDTETRQDFTLKIGQGKAKIGMKCWKNGWEPRK